MPPKLYLCGMSLEMDPTVTDALEAIKALREELASVKDELSSCKSEVSRLNRNNTHLVVENKSLKAEVLQVPIRIRKQAPITIMITLVSPMVPISFPRTMLRVSGISPFLSRARGVGPEIAS